MNSTKLFLKIFGILCFSLIIVFVFPVLCSWLFCFILPVKIAEPFGAIVGILITASLMITHMNKKGW